MPITAGCNWALRYLLMNSSDTGKFVFVSAHMHPHTRMPHPTARARARAQVWLTNPPSDVVLRNGGCYELGKLWIWGDACEELRSNSSRIHTRHRRGHRMDQLLPPEAWPGWGLVWVSWD